MTTIDHQPDGSAPAGPEGPRRPRRFGRRERLGLAAAAGALVVGIGLGGLGTALLGDRGEGTLVLQPTAINTLSDDTPVAIKGRVAEIYGNKLIVDDGTGRALVETGPAGEGGRLAAKDETITAQGRFDDGVIRARMIVHADGKVVDLGPPKPPHGPLAHRLAEMAGR